MTPKYDTGPARLPFDPGVGPRTNIVYDTSGLPILVAPSPSPAPATGASGPLTWFIDALGNRVDVTGPPLADDADDPLIVTRPS